MARALTAGHRLTSYDVRFWKIEVRKNRRTPYRVRWVVAGRSFSDSFVTMALAESFRSQLLTAARAGEGFDPDTGLPQSLMRDRQDVSFYAHSMEFMTATWTGAAAKSRVSMIETLSRVLPVVVRDVRGAPDPDVLRLALRKGLNRGQNASDLNQAEARALAWLARASRPVSALADDRVVWDVLDALATRLDGRPAAPDYFARRRKVLHLVLGYAVRKRRLTKNPLSQPNLPPGWTAPDKPEEVVDPRSVGSPALIADILAACSYVGSRQGLRFVAFFGCMYYAMMRPSEVAALTREGCHLPDRGGATWSLPMPARRQAGRSPMTGRSTSIAGSRAAPGRGEPAGRGPGGRSGRCPFPRSWSGFSARTSQSSGPATTACCSAASKATRSSPPPGGRSGRRSAASHSLRISSPRR